MHGYHVIFYLDFEDVMECIDEDPSRSLDYSPFPSAMHTLLFMLINSPRPMVG